MNNHTASPCGAWDSPISAAMVATASNRISELIAHRHSLYWLEQLADEKGRTTIVRYCDNQTRHLLQKDFNCRSRVHEYGGGAFTLHNDAIYFVNDSDQQVYFFREGDTPTQLTDKPGCRYADLTPAGDALVAIEEDHTVDAAMPANRLVLITPEGEVITLCEEYDFYASPAYSNGKLAWLCWRHPDMPWDATRLMLAGLDDDKLFDRQCIHGGDGVSVFQPQWSSAGELYYVSDKSGWWNLYRYRQQQHQALLPMQAEFGLPQWVFAQSMYCIRGNTLYACCNQNGRQQILELDLASQTSRPVASENIWFAYLTATDDGFACVASSSVSSGNVFVYQPDEHCITDNAQHALDENLISKAQPLTLLSRHGDDIHANYYPPRNPAYTQSEAPPMIVLSHGGPTAQSHPGFELKKLFWTSRGFAILDVNYSGSTGYGKAYQNRLKGEWGRRDVTDVCDAALAAVEQGLADANQLIIKGSSAGGYTVLAALTFENTFHAGASYYGISDLTTLAADTHKFEAHYLDRLIGPYPEQKQRYLERSPINHVERLNCPVIFFQGEEDRVVPKSQAERMAAALDEKGIPVVCLLFEGEQHGFRQAQTIIDTLEAELCFYRRIFRLGEPDCALEIRNLDG